MSITLKTTALVTLLGLGTAYAQPAQTQPQATSPAQTTPVGEMGRVISSTPIIQQFAAPSQVCGTQQVAVQQPKSGAGGLMGAVAGGAIGNAVGGGSGRALATMIGVIGGAAMGDNVEGQPAPQVQTVQNCTTQTNYENRTVGYNVVYEFGGKQYNTQMAQAPGPFIPLQITPAGSTPPAQQPVYAPQQAPQVAVPAPVIYAPQPVVVAAPAYPYPYGYPYGYSYGYPHVSIGFGIGRRWR